MSHTKGSQSESNPPWIPEGFVILMGPDDQSYVVPQFFVPSMQHNFDGYREKQKMEVEKAAGTVSLF
jgi:hypothetical protein